MEDRQRNGTPGASVSCCGTIGSRERPACLVIVAGGGCHDQSFGGRRRCGADPALTWIKPTGDPESCSTLKDGGLRPQPSPVSDGTAKQEQDLPSVTVNKRAASCCTTKDGGGIFSGLRCGRSKPQGGEQRRTSAVRGQALYRPPSDMSGGRSAPSKALRTASRIDPPAQGKQGQCRLMRNPGPTGCRGICSTPLGSPRIKTIW